MYKEKKPELMSLEELREYRTPKEAVYIYTHISYPNSVKTINEWWGCPSCRAVIERDGQRHCGVCGQRVSWKNFYKQK